MTFYEAFASWLSKHQKSPVYYEFLPDTPRDCVAFFVYTTIPETLGISRRIQVQVFRGDLMEAYEDAYQLSLLLDSGLDEEIIDFGGGHWGIVRPTAKPRSMGYTDNKRARYYFEIAVIGEDRS